MRSGGAKAGLTDFCLWQHMAADRSVHPCLEPCLTIKPDETSAIIGAAADRRMHQMHTYKKGRCDPLVGPRGAGRMPWPIFVGDSSATLNASRGGDPSGPSLSVEGGTQRGYSGRPARCSASPSSAFLSGFT